MKLGAPFTEQQARRQNSLQSAVALPITPLGSTTTTIFTVTTGFDFWIVHLWVANVTGGALTYTVYFVPSGGSAATGNIAVASKSLAANTSEVIDVAVNHRLKAGDRIIAVCSSANGINLGGWGYLVQGETQ